MTKLWTVCPELRIQNFVQSGPRDKMHQLVQLLRILQEVHLNMNLFYGVTLVTSSAKVNQSFIQSQKRGLKVQVQMFLIPGLYTSHPLKFW